MEILINNVFICFRISEPFDSSAHIAPQSARYKSVFRAPN
jgi:hypothetical protein